MCMVSWCSSVGTGVMAVLFVLVTPVNLIYCDARAYIVIERLISIKYLPVGAQHILLGKILAPHLIPETWVEERCSWGFQAKVGI